MLIPTRHRDRLPMDLSYPIGAEVLSEAFRGVPQYGMLSLFFTTWRQPGTAAAATKASRGAGRQHVLCANYRHLRPGHGSSGALIRSGFYEPDWSLSVYAVPRQCRSLVRALLIRDGMPLLRAWLTEPRTETWLIGQRWLLVEFSQADGTLRASQCSGS